MNLFARRWIVAPIGKRADLKTLFRLPLAPLGYTLQVRCASRSPNPHSGGRWGEANASSNKSCFAMNNQQTHRPTSSLPTAQGPQRGLGNPMLGPGWRRMGGALGEESSERSRRVSRPVYHPFPARIGVHDVLLDMAGRTVLPSSMEQETWCQRYIIIVNFLLHDKSELE